MLAFEVMRRTLTYGEANEIRVLASSRLTRYDLAELYHVSESTIGAILAGRTYRTPGPSPLVEGEPADPHETTDRLRLIRARQLASVMLGG